MRTALVTGANRGLGRETARQLAAQGFRVIRGARAPSGDERQLDVADRSSVAALAAGLAGSSIDVLVNNAGIALDGFDARVAEQTLAVNYFGAAQVTDALLALMPDGGAIVMVSSGLGELSALAAPLRERLLDPQLTREALDELMRSFIRDVREGQRSARGWPSSAYRVSKAGLNALTRVLARDLAPRRIRVNAVCPGWVRTDMGGAHAGRSVDKGAASIVWAATTSATGGFFRDGQALSW